MHILKTNIFELYLFETLEIIAHYSVSNDTFVCKIQFRANDSNESWINRYI